MSGWGEIARRWRTTGRGGPWPDGRRRGSNSYFHRGPSAGGSRRDHHAGRHDPRRRDGCARGATRERGEFIRRQGSDLAEGQKILARGELVAAQTIALLAAQGIAEIEVGGVPRVAIISTGDELVRPDERPKPGQIFESNAIMLHALALGAGTKVTLVEHCPDDLAQLTSVFRRGLEGDALVISGGVSVGDLDLVKPALRALGAEIDLWRVAIKPGKPFLFGRAGRCCIFGLPGNPVSAFVTFLKFVRPALLKMRGAADGDLGLRAVPARLATAVTNDGARPHYLRGRCKAECLRSPGDRSRMPSSV